MKGFTLIEVVISITIFLVIITIVGGSVFLGAGIYQQSREIMELTQNSRVFLDSFSREVRQAERIIGNVSEDFESPSREIIFQDGHLETFIDRGTVAGGENNHIYLSDPVSGSDGFYKNSFIKITGGSGELLEEKRRIVDYEGETGKLTINEPFIADYDYFGLSYYIDTSYYYIRYYLQEDLIKREIYTYYFSGDSDSYVPFNATPPEGETLEKDLFESRVVGEYFTDLQIWRDESIKARVILEIGDKKVDMINAASGRNL